MAHAQLERVLGNQDDPRCAPPRAEKATDAQLLARFAADRDEAAFASLVERYGPMVLGVCRRVLNDFHAAEDAFQAAFLVLARKAGALAKPELLGHWLYGVAYRTAQKAKTLAARRSVVERQVKYMAPTEISLPELDADLRTLLDEELHRLPEKHRIVLVLCYLEGKTHEEAARLLGWPTGSMSWRLAQSREMLRARLNNRGFACSGPAFATLCAGQAAATVPAALAHSTLKAAVPFSAGAAVAASETSASAVFLAQEVLKGMAATKWRAAAALAALILLIGLGGGAIAYELWPDKPVSEMNSPGGRCPPETAVNAQPDGSGTEAK